MTALIISVSTVLAIFIIALVISYVCYRMAFHSPKKNQGDPHAFPKGPQYEPLRERTYSMVENLLSEPFESVYVKSHDGLTLHARYYHRNEGAPLAIGLHGYRSTSIRDFCGGGRLALDMGHNLLLIDQRAHGKSEGHAITFGVNERRDCLSWINWACERFGSIPIMLYGVSMGAATVLMVSGMDLPENVKLGIADCPYSSPVAIISKVARDMHYPSRLIYPFVWLGARIFGGFNIAEMTAARAVANAKIPLMIIHGEGDDFVPSSMSDEAVTANPKAVVKHTFPDAGHALSYMYDTERYQSLVREFISKNISNTNI